MSAKPDCPFCQLTAASVVWQSDRVVAARDRYPVSPGHTLLIPRRHVATYFDADALEQTEIWRGVAEIKAQLDREFAPHGYNVGFNAGETAGQTVMHLHVHVIPRYRGDTDDPRGGVRGVIPSKQKYGASSERSAGAFADLPRFAGGQEQHFGPVLRTAMRRAEQIDIVSAFVQPSGLSVILGDLEDALERGARARIVTGDYLAITHPDALRSLYALATDHPRLEAWVYECRPGESFHPKSYLFVRGNDGVAYVGSSNLSATALAHGVEWNLRAVASTDAEAFGAVRARVEHLLRHPQTRPLDRAWIDAYSQRTRVPPSPDPRAPAPEPTSVQREALDALRAARAEGAHRGLVVLATGLGKTFLAAFDFAAFGGNRVLFIAHREEILKQARDTWARVFPERTLGLLGVGEHAPDAELLFASIQTLARSSQLERFAPDAFDYVVVDEFHHASAGTYRRVLAHFAPRFLLGLTATPDRMDGASLLALCEDRLVYRRDLVHGIAQKLLVPFRYFGVRDEVDFAPIPWRSGRFDAAALTRAVATEERAAQALREYERHSIVTPRRTLAFCCTTEHADFMAAYLTRHGLRAAAVHSGETSAPRAESLRRLQAGDLEILCAVDIFNEGLDLPDVNTVLMLRPTESPVVFLQQLGRGLRRAEGKAYLTVVDFIGNHRSFLQKPQALVYLTGQSLPAFAALRQLRDGELALPEGCHVEIETEAIDMLERLCRPGSDDILLLTYAGLRDSHGRRPTAAEVHAANVHLRPVSDRYGSWFDFVRQQGDLTANEARVLERHRTWFGDLLGTRMNRSFKMVALQALLDLDVLRGRTSVARVAARSHAILATHPLLHEELGEAEGETEGGASRDFVTWWRQMPLAVWTRGESTSQAWFRFDGADFVSRLEVAPEDSAIFDEMTTEMVEYRLREYEDRLRRKVSLGPEMAPMVLRVAHAGGRPVLRYDRKALPKLPSGEVAVRVDGKHYTLAFRENSLHSAVEAPGLPNALPGLMRAWFGPAAGKPGTRHRVLLELDDEHWRLRPDRGEDGGLADLVPFPGLPYYPDLQVACGAFRAGTREESAKEILHVQGTVALDPKRHFVVRASGDSMDGGATPIADGDLVLCQWLEGARAQDVEGRACLLLADEGAALKVPRRAASGWVLESWNPAHPPRPVPAGHGIEPVALFVEVVEETLAPVLWGLYDRKRIAALLGQRYGRPWQQGPVDLNIGGREVTALFVTLRKDDQPEAKWRYADEFISRTEFQWESQASTGPEGAKGRRVIEHERQGRRMELFVRYHSDHAFVYCGPVRYVRHEGARPMRVWFRLERELPEGLWRVWAPRGMGGWGGAGSGA